MSKILFLLFILNKQLFANPIMAGGPDSVDNVTFDAFKNPYPSMPATSKGMFSVGHSFFTNAWTTAPGSVVTRDGLGPTFNSVACAGCHNRDGRGLPYSNNKVAPALLVRISNNLEGAWLPDINYGDQINPIGINGIDGEAKVLVSFTEIENQYPDGEVYTLRKPTFSIENLNFGPLSENTKLSPRVAPQMIGLGLIESISEQDILSHEDPIDKNNDGISGRANWPKDILTGQKSLGRFGWKANQPSLNQQNASAFLGDMGLTTSLLPIENCPGNQIGCKKAINGGMPEVSDEIMNAVNFYTKSLAVPTSRMKDAKKYTSGFKIFSSINCNSCHVQHYKTSKTNTASTSEVDIYPYSDFLLHDMGEDLADNRPDVEASGNEWRTPPLWGLGLVPIVNGHSFYLHDGRARSIEEAILWHDGEASVSKEKFKKLRKNERLELINFVNSL